MNTYSILLEEAFTFHIHLSIANVGENRNHHGLATLVEGDRQTLLANFIHARGISFDIPQMKQKFCDTSIFTVGAGLQHNFQGGIFNIDQMRTIFTRRMETRRATDKEKLKSNARIGQDTMELGDIGFA